MATSRANLAATTAAIGASLALVAGWTQSTLGHNLLPHAFCITGSQPLLVLHVLSDSFIALAYLLIPWALLRIIRQRQDIPFGWIAWLFGAFIFACGATHAVEVWTLWEPVYWYAGVLKAFTAAVSLATAGVLYRISPQILAIPSAQALRASNSALQREVEARREAEKALLQSQAELQALLARTSAQAQNASAVLDTFFDSAPLGLAVVNLDATLPRVNRAFAALNALPPDGGAALTVRELPPEVGAALARMLESRTPVSQQEMHVRDSQGDERILLASFFPIRGSSGSQFGCAMEDKTYQRQMEQERQNALKQAQDARDATENLNRELEQRVERRTGELSSLLAEMESFSSSIAHDLRAPLTTLSGYSQVVLNTEKSVSERGRNYLARVVAAAARMDEIITALLDIARLPHQALQQVEFDLAPIARSIAADLQAADPQRRAEIRIEAGIPLVGDPVLLRQVMVNLLGNSWKFSAREDAVRIEVGRVPTPRGVAVYVRDHGAGFDASRPEYLFQMFHRMHSALEFSGSGVGLAIVKRIVQRHGGDIWAESKPGEGATFYFILGACSA